MKKIAIFIDWDNFRKELDAVTRKTKTDISNFNYNDLNKLMKLIKNFIDEEQEELYRIFIYTAPPLSYQDVEKELKKRKTSQKELKLFEKNKSQINAIFVKSKEFIEKIALQDYVALRKGILKIGEINNGSVTINQKQVDMLIGLDIAQLSYENRVDRILVFSKDSDMKPAIKVARINGINTIIANFKESLGGIPKELKTHVDTIRTRSFVEFVNQYKK